MSSPPKDAGASPTQLPYTHALDGWADAQYHKPEADKYVCGWTGRSICKVKYDYARQIWITDNGVPIKVLIWTMD